MVQEAIVIDILALVSIKVQLGQAVVVNLLQQLPVGLDVDGCVPVASRLVVILPTKAAAASAGVAATSPVVTSTIAATSPSATFTGALKSTTTAATGIATATSLAAAATSEDGTAAIS